MAYQRGKTAQPAVTVQSVEQARRRNAELRIELASLTAEYTTLEAQVAAVRLRVSEARRLLTRKVRDLEATRLQVRSLSAVKALPEPVYGGREGLEAATKELEEHESRGIAPRPRRVKGPSHGTRDRYYTGCRCDECLAWRERKSKRGLASYHARQAQLRRAA